MPLWRERPFMRCHYSDFCSDMSCDQYDDFSNYSMGEMLDYFDSIGASKKHISRQRVPLDGILSLKTLDDREIIVSILEVIGSGTGSIAYLVDIDGRPSVLKQLYPQRLNDEYLLDGTSFGLVVRCSLKASYMWHKRKKEFISSAYLQTQLHRVPCLQTYVQPLIGILSSGDTLCTLTDTFDGYSWDQQNKYSLDQLLEITIEITKLVQHIHDQGYLVVDIKPSNFVVSRNKDGKIIVKLIDFDGLVKLHSKSKYKYSSETGPVEYKANNHKEIGEWSDVYCIVAMFSDSIFGHHKLKRISNNNLSTICKSDYSAWVQAHHDSLKELLVHGLHDDRRARIQTCKELLEYLSDLT